MHDREVQGDRILHYCWASKKRMSYCTLEEYENCLFEKKNENPWGENFFEIRLFRRGTTKERTTS